MRTLIISLWVTQTLVVFQLVYKQCTTEVLFVDWEPARAPTRRARSLSWPVGRFRRERWAELQTADVRCISSFGWGSSWLV